MVGEKNPSPAFISQNKLAVILGIERGSVYRWVHEKGIDPAAAEMFVELYLGELIKNEDER